MRVTVNILQKSTPVWLTAVTAIVALVGMRNGCRANEIAKQSQTTADDSLEIARAVHEAKDIPRLVAFPVTVRFYIPEIPEVPGQVKITMGAIIENLSEVDARHVGVNFETLDWYDHPTNLFELYRAAQRPSPRLLSLPKGSKFIYPSYTPDAPATGEAGYVSQDKPFKLKLSIYWKDINDKDYVYVGFYELKHASRPDGGNDLYFQPTETFDSVKDGETAWKRSKEPFSRQPARQDS